MKGAVSIINDKQTGEGGASCHQGETRVKAARPALVIYSAV